MSEIKVNSIKGIGATNAAITVNNSDGTCTANITNNLSNRNAIINGAMIISQRGINFGTLASTAYTLDRWNVDAGATVQQASLAVDEISDDKKFTKAIQMQGASSDYFRTKLEDVSNFSNQTLILSFYVKGASNTTLDNIYARQNFGSGGSSIVDTAFSNLSYSVTTSYTRYTATVTLPSISGKTVGTSSYLEIFMELPDSVTVYITGVQLEVDHTGSGKATDFEHRSFGQELALCQRYYERLDYAGGTMSSGLMGFYNTDTEVFVFNHHRVIKRATPSLEYSALTDLDIEPRDRTVPNLTLFRSDTKFACLRINGVTDDNGKGEAACLTIDQTGGFIAFDAEL